MNLRLPERVRVYPGFWALGAVLVVATGGGAIEAVRQAGRWRAAEAECARLRMELLAPQARPELIAAAGVALERAREQLRQARMNWPDFAETAAPGDRLEAYAELVAFRERMRAQAAAAGVALAKGEAFGFAQHAQTAPAAAVVLTVRTQQRTLERVLQALFASEPGRLVGVWRENPQPEAAARDGEWCVWPAARSLRLPGLVETQATRVAFVGTTACLRGFLNRLAGESALVVREVAAEPGEDKAARGTAQHGTRASRRFTVTLEAVAVAGGTGAESTARAREPPPWRSPAGGRGGGLFAMAPAEDGRERRSGRVEALEKDESWGSADFGVALLAVRRVPYRWRLVGHVGGAESSAVLLEEAATRRGALLRIGARDPASGLELVAVDFGRGADGGRLVRATLHDPAETVPVELGTAGGADPTRGAAVLRVHGRSEPVEVAEGGTVEANGDRYTIGVVSPETATAEVTRMAANGRPAERRTLAVAAQ